MNYCARAGFAVLFAFAIATPLSPAHGEEGPMAIATLPPRPTPPAHPRTLHVPLPKVKPQRQSTREPVPLPQEKPRSALAVGRAPAPSGRSQRTHAIAAPPPWGETHPWPEALPAPAPPQSPRYAGAVPPPWMRPPYRYYPVPYYPEFYSAPPYAPGARVFWMPPGRYPPPFGPGYPR